MARAICKTLHTCLVRAESPHWVPGWPVGRAQPHQSWAVHRSAQYEGRELLSEQSPCLSPENTLHVGSGTLPGTKTQVQIFGYLGVRPE